MIRRAASSIPVLHAADAPLPGGMGWGRVAAEGLGLTSVYDRPLRAEELERQRGVPHSPALLAHEECMAFGHETGEVLGDLSYIYVFRFSQSRQDDMLVTCVGYHRKLNDELFAEGLQEE